MWQTIAWKWENNGKKGMLSIFKDWHQLRHYGSFQSSLQSKSKSLTNVIHENKSVESTKPYDHSFAFATTRKAEIFDQPDISS